VDDKKEDKPQQASTSALSYSDRMRMEMERERTGVGASSAKPSTSDAGATPAVSGKSRTDSLRGEREREKKSRTRDSLGGLENLDKIMETEVSTDSSSSLVRRSLHFQCVALHGLYSLMTGCIHL
jgi:hypothetical protein